MQISFHGAADSVTGSRHLVQIGNQRILLDCGLFQGYKLHRQRNWAEPPPEMLEADAVVLSHAHLDHSGWLPVLVRHGYKGPVFASPATRDLAEVLLLDSAHLQEEDARRANRYGYSRHAKALPLYTKVQARRAIERIRPLKPGRELKLGQTTVRLDLAGHLLGACTISLATAHERLLFSGDLGRADDLLMPAPPPPRQADVMIVESTYGNRRHSSDDPQDKLGAIVRDTIGRGGSVLLPSFAVGRCQALLVLLHRLKARGEIPPELPVFLDSPMAIEATALYRRHVGLLRLKPREARALVDGVRMVTTPQQSMRLVRSRYPSVIISASGMATGGRVLHHLKAMAPDPRHHVVFPGFQVGGSRGAHLVGGETEVKIHGDYVPVRASVSQLEGLSGHADGDGILAWLQQLPQAPRHCFVVHGEPDASDRLRHRIKNELRWRVEVPEQGSTVRA